MLCHTAGQPPDPMSLRAVSSCVPLQIPMSLCALSHNGTADTTNPSLMFHGTERLCCHTAGQPPIPMSIHAVSHWGCVTPWDNQLFL